MEVVDLTNPVDSDTPTHPDDPDMEMEEAATVEEDGYAVKRLVLPSHLGTHVDAPAHMFGDGRTVDDYPVKRFVGEAVVIDARGEDVVDIGRERVDEDADMLLFRTGDDSAAYDGGYSGGGPVLTERTAEACVSAGADLVGIDSGSPDESPYPVHDILLGNDILLLENLTNLGAVTGERFLCYALPLNIAEGDGAPCRVVGVID